MTLPQLSLSFSLPDLIRGLFDWLRIIEEADAQNLKRGSDIEMATARVIGTTPDGTRRALVFNDDGTITTVEV